MRGLVLVGLLAAVANGAAAEAHGERLPTPRTLVTVPGYVEGFAQDGDRIVWAIESGRCGRNVVLRTLSTGRSAFLDTRKGPMCESLEYAGEFQPWMALAGTRALWARESPSLSHYNYSLFMGAPGDRAERRIAGMSIEGGLGDDDGALIPVPLAGKGRSLVFADINTDESEPSGVYRVVGRQVNRVAGTRLAFSVAAAAPGFALARLKPAGCACNALPAWSPDGARIAFRSGRTGESPQLLVMNADGTSLRKIIDDATEFAWAPDGGSFAVALRDSVVIVNGDGDGIRTVTRGDCSCDRELAWAPDGRHLVYNGGTQASQQHVFVFALGTRNTIDLGRGANPRWSPDSRQVAYTRWSEQEGDRVYVATAAAGTPVDVGLGTDPQWAPSAPMISVQRQDGTYELASDGSTQRRLGPRGVLSPDWRWIAYNTGPEDDQTLWVVRTGGGSAQKLVDGGGGNVTWSPDSHVLAYAQSNWRLTVVDVETGARRATTSGVDCFFPSWSPDSARLVCAAPTDPATYFDLYEAELAVVDARNGTTSIVTNTAPEPQRMIVETRTPAGKLSSSFDGPKDLRGIAWGGTRFALLVPRSKTQATIEIRSALGQLQRSVNVPRPWFDQLSMSGRSVVFRVGGTVRRLDAATGGLSVLARAPKANIVGLSVDGRRVAWAESTYKRSRIRAVLLPRS